MTLPQLQYVVFEAVRIPILTADDGTESYGPPEQDKVLLLDRIYTSINYVHKALTTNTKFFGDDNYLNDKGGLAPVQIRISGTFGYQALRRGRILRTGFERYKEFRDELFNKVQSVKDSLVDNTLPNRKRYIYQVNLYDMINQWWGRIDMKEFAVNGDARINSKLLFYTINIAGIGKIIDVAGSDFLLRLIKSAIKTAEVKAQIQEQILKWIDEQPFIGEVFRTGNEILDVLADIDTSIGFANEYISQANQMGVLYEQATGGIASQLLGSFGNLSVNSLGGQIQSYIPIIVS